MERPSPVVLQLIFLCLLFSTSQSFSQDVFRVLKVRGEIYNKADNKFLEAGDQLAESDRVVLADKAVAHLYHKEKGRMYLRNNGLQPANGGDEMMWSVAELLSPSTRLLSSRGSRQINGFSDLQYYFDTQTYCVLGERHSLPLNPEAIPLSDTQFFYISYRLDGAEVNTMLSHATNELLLDKNEIYQVEGKAISQCQVDGLSLHYYYVKEERSEKLASFRLYFLSDRQLSASLDWLVNDMLAHSKPPAEILLEVEGMVRDEYGKVDRRNLANWMRDQYGLDLMN